MNENYINYLKERLNNAKAQWRDKDIEFYGVSMQLDDMAIRKFANFFSSALIADLILFTNDPVLISLIASGSMIKYLSKSKKLISKQDELAQRKEELMNEKDRLERIIYEKSREIAAEYNEDESNHVREDEYVYEDEEMSLGLRK